MLRQNPTVTKDQIDKIIASLRADCDFADEVRLASTGSLFDHHGDAPLDADAIVMETYAEEYRSELACNRIDGVRDEVQRRAAALGLTVECGTIDERLIGRAILTEYVRSSENAAKQARERIAYLYPSLSESDSPPEAARAPALIGPSFPDGTALERNSSSSISPSVPIVAPANTTVDQKPATPLATGMPASIPSHSGVADVPTTITGLADRLAALREKSKEWTDKTARQMRQSAGLLAKVVGHDDFSRLTQRDFATFRDVLLELPKSYGKSSRDASKPLAQLIAEGRGLPESERGAEPATNNRHLTHLGSLIQFASGYALHPAQPIMLSQLRAKKAGRNRDDRPPMTTADMRAIVALPVWHGCASESKRLEPGNVIIHDALYWVPLIASYSLARREEVCGLMVADVVFDAAIPHFDIRPNKYRRLKNPQSKRKVPIHSELMRLALREYVAAIAALGYDLLFPDLLPARCTGPLGDQFQDLWAPVLATAVPDAETTGKVFHSIRHFGNDALVDARVMIEWRQDILGHGGRSEAEERYRDATRLKRKLTALKKLPNITSSLLAHPVKLTTSVMKKLARKPRQTRSAQ
ncbi:MULTISPECIES: hypothetical protein [unclassified Bradyrhizobium]|uniref:hypothetical protein n=1 Tax=unclassified Bradyrhizobium TaxID=2631580 RepID=UPI002915E7D4|nr:MULTISPECIES: hypothetical protein [unclassified Bradyrhizobium]